VEAERATGRKEKTRKIPTPLPYLTFHFPPSIQSLQGRIKGKTIRLPFLKSNCLNITDFKNQISYLV
jgi:hypothetical protein